MPLDGILHCRTVPLPARSTLLDVDKEEGGGPLREIGHDPSQCMRSVALLADCRTPLRCWSRRGQLLGDELCAVVRRVPHEHAHDDREESQSCFSDIPIRQNTIQLASAISPYDDDGVRWLALVLKVAVIR